MFYRDAQGQPLPDECRRIAQKACDRASARVGGEWRYTEGWSVSQVQDECWRLRNGATPEEWPEIRQKIATSVKSVLAAPKITEIPKTDAEDLAEALATDDSWLSDP